MLKETKACPCGGTCGKQECAGKAQRTYYKAAPEGAAYAMETIARALSERLPFMTGFTVEEDERGQLLIRTGMFRNTVQALLPAVITHNNCQPCSGDCEDCPGHIDIDVLELQREFDLQDDDGQAEYRGCGVAWNA